MNKRSFLFLLILILASPPVRAHGAVLDGFRINDAGSVKISGAGIRAVAVQPWDGKIVIGGEFTIAGGTPQISLKNLARINTDGTLDAGFTPAPNGGAVNSIVIQRDQNLIYVGGSFNSVTSKDGLKGRNGLARLKSGDGTVDDFNPATQAGTVINALTLHPDARSILVGGSFTQMAGVSCSNIAMVSVSSPNDGMLTGSFSAGTSDAVDGGAVNAILLQDGMVLVGGSFSTPRPYLARFDASGARDRNFLAAPGAAVRSLALQADGKIVLGGDFTWIASVEDPGGRERKYLARLQSNGTLDDFNPSANDYVTSIVVQPDGRILAGGDFTKIGPSATARNRVARFKPDGSLDGSINPDADAVINAIALQPDGKFLVAGGFSTAAGKARTRLARFYFNGALDDDASPLDPSLAGDVMTLSLQPDGSTTIAGLIRAAPPEVGGRVAKLNANLSLDNSFGPGLCLTNQVNVQALQPDGNLIVGGWFPLVNGATQKYVTRLDATGTPDATFASYFNGLSRLAPNSRVQALALLPRGSRMSKETWSEGRLLAKNSPLDDGMVYLGGVFKSLDAGNQTIYLVRVKMNGELDTTFNPPLLDGIVYSVVIQPDDRILIGGDFTGRIMRLETNGDRDESFKPLVPDYAITSIGLQKDGQILIAGAFTKLESATQSIVRYNIARLNNLRRLLDDGSMADDGSVDLSFQVEPIDNLYGESMLNGFSLQSDGSMLLYGFFDQVRDGSTTKTLDCVARVGTGGKLDDLSLFAFKPANRRLGLVNVINLQADGKIVVGGGFTVLRDSAPTNNLARFSNGWATQELSLEGSAITWLRTGTGPELWGVTFEESGNPEGPWTFLGRGESIPGGWGLGGQGLVPSQNRYLRARGYVVGSGGNSSGSIMESVRLYYLKQTKKAITITSGDASREYGAENSPLISNFSMIGSLASGDVISGITVSSAATATAPVGSYELTPIAALFGSGSADHYDITYKPGTLTVIKKNASVKPTAASKSYGDPDPPALHGTLSGFLPDDLVSATYSRTPGERAGLYSIVATLAPAGVLGNYDITYQAANLIINRKPATVSALAKGKTYGGVDPELTVAHSGFLVGDLGAGKISFTTARAAGENAGTYDITPMASDDGTVLLANYACSYLPGTFAISKSPLAVTADNKSRTYLAANPQLTASYQGFVRGDSAAAISGGPDLWTAATPASPAGSYGIIASLGTLAARNYSFILANGALSVTKSCQEIVFPALGERTFGDPPFEIGASACSGLGITFASSDPRVATISGNLLTITGAGSVVITASQGGSDNLDRAPDVSQTVIVHRGGQTVSFPSLARKVLGDPPFLLKATASSGLPVSYQSSDRGVVEITGSMVTIVGAGTAVITALQPGNGNYNPALPASQPLTVALEGVPPRLQLSTLSSGSITANPVLNIMGVAGDDSGIASLTVNGADLTDRAALFSAAVPLCVGDNSIEVTAQDGAGNRTTETVSITLEAGAPEISLRTPADNSVTNAPLFVASGTVSPGSRVTLGVNGAALQILIVAEGAFTGSGYLEPGVNTIELSAALSGRVSGVKRSVILAPGKPSVAIMDPVQDLRTEKDSITIRGEVGGEVASVVLDLGGEGFSPVLQAGLFQQIIPLAHPGEFRITVRATDIVGNSSVAQRNIIRVDRIMGDLDGDGYVDIGDAVAALRISLGMDQATTWALAHGDLAPLVNGAPHPDGKIDVGDLLVLLRKIVGLVDF